MALFEYIAKSSPGEAVRGEMHAESATAVSVRLSETGLFPLEISPVREDRLLAFRLTGRFLHRTSRNALVLFTRQLANLLAAGMELHTALRLVQVQMTEGPLRRVSEDLVGRLQEGSRFSEACSAWPKVFSEFYVNMIRAGEAGGMLELVLAHLADFLERQDDLQKQIRATLAYPLLMLGMGLLTITILLSFVVPRIVSMFDEIGQTLPLPTRLLIAASSLVTHHWLEISVLVFGIAIFLRRKFAQPAFREKMDLLKLRLPFVGSLLLEAEVAQFARTLRALLEHGVPVHRAFEVVVAACRNVVVRRDFETVTESIRHGKRIGLSLQSTTHLPPLLGHMIAIAEDTNQLETVLHRIAKSGSKEVERRVAVFTKLLEPLMIILLGAMIGFIVFAMMLPIFQIDFVVQ